MARVRDRIADKPDFRLEDGVLYFRDRLCVPNVENLKDQIMTGRIMHDTLYIPVVLRCIRIYGVNSGGIT